MDFWQVFPVAVALVFVIEGMLPFINPSLWKDLVAAAAALDDASIRRIGLASMVCGLLILHFST